MNGEPISMAEHPFVQFLRTAPEAALEDFEIVQIDEIYYMTNKPLPGVMPVPNKAQSDDGALTYEAYRFNGKYYAPRFIGTKKQYDKFLRDYNAAEQDAKMKRMDELNAFKVPVFAKPKEGKTATISEEPSVVDQLHACSVASAEELLARMKGIDKAYYKGLSDGRQQVHEYQNKVLNDHNWTLPPMPKYPTNTEVWVMKFNKPHQGWVHRIQVQSEYNYTDCKHIMTYNVMIAGGGISTGLLEDTIFSTKQQLLDSL